MIFSLFFWLLIKQTHVAIIILRVELSTVYMYIMQVSKYVLYSSKYLRANKLCDFRDELANHENQKCAHLPAHVRVATK